MRPLFLIPTALLMAGTLSACGSSAATRPTTLSAAIHNYEFSPRILRISTGDSVTWKNSDAANHTVTDNQGAGSFASSSLGKGATFSAKFARAGVFHYHCAFHPFMTGTVIVRAPHA